MGSKQEEPFYRLLCLLDIAPHREPGTLISPLLHFASLDFSHFYPSINHLLHRYLPRFTHIQTWHYKLHSHSDSLNCNKFIVTS